VLGLDDETVEAACRRVDGEAWIANFNAPGQVIVAGTSEALAEFSAIAKELGAKRVLSMPVGGAFHTPSCRARAIGSARPSRPRASMRSTRWSWRTWTPACTTIRRVAAAAVRAAVQSGPLAPEPRHPPGRRHANLRRAWARWRADRLVAARGSDNGRDRVSVSTPDDLDHLVEILADGIVGAAPAGERFHMTERLSSRRR